MLSNQPHTPLRSLHIRMYLQHSHCVPITGTTTDRHTLPSRVPTHPKELNKSSAASAAGTADSYWGLIGSARPRCTEQPSPSPVTLAREGAGLVCCATSCYDTLMAGALCDLGQVSALLLWAQFPPLFRGSAAGHLSLWFTGATSKPSVTVHCVISHELNWYLGLPCSQGHYICPWHLCRVQASMEEGRQEEEDGRAFTKRSWLWEATQQPGRGGPDTGSVGSSSQVAHSHSPLPGTHYPALSSPASTPPTTRHFAEHVSLLLTAKDDLY